MFFEFQDCGGCKTCEIACSFLKSGEFNHSVAAIEVVAREGDRGYDVRFFTESPDGRYACDGCPGREEPMCVQYCRKYEDLMEIIGRLRENLAEKGAGAK